jgi:hypothetical protein
MLTLILFYSPVEEDNGLLCLSCVIMDDVGRIFGWHRSEQKKLAEPAGAEHKLEGARRVIGRHIFLPPSSAIPRIRLDSLVPYCIDTESLFLDHTMQDGRQPHQPKDAVV